MENQYESQDGNQPTRLFQHQIETTQCAATESTNYEVSDDKKSNPQIEFYLQNNPGQDQKDKQLQSDQDLSRINDNLGQEQDYLYQSPIESESGIDTKDSSADNQDNSMEDECYGEEEEFSEESIDIENPIVSDDLSINMEIEKLQTQFEQKLRDSYPKSFGNNYDHRQLIERQLEVWEIEMQVYYLQLGQGQNYSEKFQKYLDKKEYANHEKMLKYFSSQDTQIIGYSLLVNLAASAGFDIRKITKDIDFYIKNNIPYYYLNAFRLYFLFDMVDQYNN